MLHISLQWTGSAAAAEVYAGIHGNRQTTTHYLHSVLKLGVSMPALTKLE